MRFSIPHLEMQELLLGWLVLALVLPCLALAAGRAAHSAAFRSTIYRAGVALVLAAMVAWPFSGTFRPSLWSVSVQSELPTAMSVETAAPALKPADPVVLVSPEPVQVRGVVTPVEIAEPAAPPMPVLASMPEPVASAPMLVSPVWLWAIPTMALAAWWLVGIGITWRVRRGAQTVSDFETREALHVLCAATDTAPPPLLEHEQLGSPVLMGPVRPAIGLPMMFAQRHGMPAVRVALAHEMAHLVRRDLWWAAAARLMCTLAWFSPTAHLLAHRLEEAGEEACDAETVALGCRPKDVAELLLNLAECRGTTPASAVSLFSRHSGLGRRVRRILDQGPVPGKVGPMLKIALAAGAVLCGVGVSAVTPKLLQDPTKPIPASPAAPAKPAEAPVANPAVVAGEAPAVVISPAAAQEPKAAEAPVAAKSKKSTKASDKAEANLSKALKEAIADITKTALEFANQAKAKGEKKLTPAQERILEQKSQAVERIAEKFGEMMAKRGEELAAKAEAMALRAEGHALKPEDIAKIQKEAAELGARASELAIKSLGGEKGLGRLKGGDLGALKALDSVKLGREISELTEKSLAIAGESLKSLGGLDAVRIREGLPLAPSASRRATPDAKPVEVPILSEVPIVNRLFRKGETPAPSDAVRERAQTELQAERYKRSAVEADAIRAELDRARELFGKEHPAIKQLENRLDRLKSRSADNPVYVRPLVSDSALETRTLEQARKRLEDAREKYTETAPQYRDALKQYEQARAKSVEGYRVDVVRPRSVEGTRIDPNTARALDAYRVEGVRTRAGVPLRADVSNRDVANELKQLRAMIRQLEEENRKLKDEYRRNNPTLPDPL